MMTTELSKLPMQKLKHSWKANRNLLPKKIPSKQRRIKKTERKKMKRIKVDNFQKLPFVRHFTKKNGLFFYICTTIKPNSP